MGEATLIVNVANIEAQTGNILVALYADQTAFNDETEPYRSANVPADRASAVVTFDGLKAGQYAFKLFHDVNGNGELDTDMLGIPSEPYGFSRDASDPFSAPEWKEAVFSLENGETERQISLD